MKPNKPHDECAVHGRAGTKGLAEGPLESLRFTFTEPVLGHKHPLHKIGPNSTVISIQKHLEVFIRITSRITFITRVGTTILMIFETLSSFDPKLFFKALQYKTLKGFFF